MIAAERAAGLAPAETHPRAEEFQRLEEPAGKVPTPGRGREAELRQIRDELERLLGRVKRLLGEK